MIVAAGMAALVARAVVSLVIVLGVVAVAYVVARRRQGAGGARPARSRALPRFGQRRHTPPGMEVVARVGLSRGSAAVAVRFGEKVVLITATEQGHSTVLAEMPATEWDELHTVREPLATPSTPAVAARRSDSPRPSFVEALRQATARHA